MAMICRGVTPCLGVSMTTTPVVLGVGTLGTPEATPDKIGWDIGSPPFLYRIMHIILWMQIYFSQSPWVQGCCTLRMICSILYSHALSTRTQNRDPSEDRERRLAACSCRRFKRCCGVNRYAGRRPDARRFLQTLREQRRVAR